MTLVTSSGALVIVFLPHPQRNVAAVCVSVLIAEVVCQPLILSPRLFVVKWACVVVALVSMFDLMLIR